MEQRKLGPLLPPLRSTYRIHNVVVGLEFALRDDVVCSLAVGDQLPSRLRTVNRVVQLVRSGSDDTT